ncbi:MAG: MXAN_5187 C-terminal domain-containing protein [Myxococcota bacterium]
MEHKEFEALLNDVEVRLERLRALYEQWFQGIERLEPAVPAKDVERRMYLLRKNQAHVRNTALRFRFQTVWQRYNTFQTYWRRVARQIEEGTYRRDVMRVRARREEQRRQRERVHRQTAPAHELDVEIDVEEALADAERAVEEQPTLPPSPKPTSSAPVPRVSKPPRSFVSPFARTPGSKAPPADGRRGPPPPPVPKAPPAPNAAGRRSALEEERLRSLYREYVEARKRNNERVDNVRYETLAKNVQAMVPKLQQKHKGKRIDFEVVVQNGRVGLKPVPK